MNISTVISTEKFKKESSLANKYLLLIAFVVLVAIINGVLIYIFSYDYLSDSILEKFFSFSVDFTSKSTLEIFSGIFISHIPYIVLMVLFAYSAVGTHLILISSFIKVSGLSVIVSYLYSSFGLQGIEYAVMIFFPGKIILIFSIVYLMLICLENSNYIRGVIKGEYRQENNRNLYLIKISVVIVLLFLSSIIECLLVSSFSSLFSF